MHLVTCVLIVVLLQCGHRVASDGESRALYEDMLAKQSLYGDCWLDAIALVNESCSRQTRLTTETEARATLAMYNCFLAKIEGRQVRCPDDQRVVKCPELHSELRNELHRQVYVGFLNMRNTFCDHWTDNETSSRTGEDLPSASDESYSPPHEGFVGAASDNNHHEERNAQQDERCESCEDAQQWYDLTDRVCHLCAQLWDYTIHVCGQAWQYLSVHAASTVMDRWEGIPDWMLEIYARLQNVFQPIYAPASGVFSKLFSSIRSVIDVLAQVAQSLCPPVLHCASYIIARCRQIVELLRFAAPFWVRFPRIALTDVHTCQGVPYKMSLKIIENSAQFWSFVAHVWGSDLLRIHWKYRDAQVYSNRRTDLILIVLVGVSYLFERKLITYSLNNCPGAGTDGQAVRYLSDNQRASRTLLILLALIVLLMETVANRRNENTTSSSGRPTNEMSYGVVGEQQPCGASPTTSSPQVQQG